MRRPGSPRPASQYASAKLQGQRFIVQALLARNDACLDSWVLDVLVIRVRSMLGRSVLQTPI